MSAREDGVPYWNTVVKKKHNSVWLSYLAVCRSLCWIWFRVAQDYPCSIIKSVDYRMMNNVCNWLLQMLLGLLRHMIEEKPVVVSCKANTRKGILWCCWTLLGRGWLPWVLIHPMIIKIIFNKCETGLCILFSDLRYWCWNSHLDVIFIHFLLFCGNLKQCS